jgi:hypothetical protein
VGSGEKRAGGRKTCCLSVSVSIRYSYLFALGLAGKFRVETEVLHETVPVLKRSVSIVFVPSNDRQRRRWRCGPRNLGLGPGYIIYDNLGLGLDFGLGFGFVFRFRLFGFGLGFGLSFGLSTGLSLCWRLRLRLLRFLLLRHGSSSYCA